MRALLDVNVLIALFDSAHLRHRDAREWLTAQIRDGWASCPITQNGFVRIISQPAYPQAISPSRAIRMLADAAATEHHEFWPDEVSLLDARRFAHDRIHGPRQLTDAYLLALAVARKGRFVTFDTAVVSSAVRGVGAGQLVVL
jgi:toxin-antitoxin system PIN domain toxin